MQLCIKGEECMNLIISSKLTSNPNRSSPKKHHHPHKTYEMFSKLIVAALASAGVASALPTAPGQAMNTTLQTSKIKLNLIKTWKVFSNGLQMKLKANYPILFQSTLPPTLTRPPNPTLLSMVLRTLTPELPSDRPKLLTPRL